MTSEVFVIPHLKTIAVLFKSRGNGKEMAFTRFPVPPGTATLAATALHTANLAAYSTAYSKFGCIQHMYALYTRGCIQGVVYIVYSESHDTCLSFFLSLLL